MKRFKTLLTIGFIAVLNAGFFASAQESISYKLSMPEPHTHYFHVEIAVDRGSSDSLDFKLPVWAPGSYLVRDFPKHIEGFQAYDEKGALLPFSKITKNTWRVAAANAERVVVKYQTYAFETSVRTSFLDASHGFVSGSSVFMFIDGKKHLPVNLEVTPWSEWTKVSTGLKRKSGGAWRFEAPDYDAFIDAPIEIGNHKVLSFKAGGKDHEVAMYGKAGYDDGTIVRDLTKVVETASEVFGQIPNDYYLFIVHNLDNRGGGLEHHNSTTLQVDRWAYSNPALYKGFLSLAAHEYFHLWWAKRARPIELGPFDYDRENYTSLLWAMEGFTSYYDELLLRRSGFYSQSEYLNKLMGTIGYIEGLPGASVQSAAMASMDAWIKAYQPNENSANTSVSYYSKGAVLGAMLDLEIIHSTNGRKKLDDALRYLYEEYYEKRGRGFTEEELKRAIEQTAGKKLDRFFRDYVYGVEKIDYNQYFNYAGLHVYETPSTDLSLGITISEDNGKLIVQSMLKGSPAWDGGINVNDEIIAFDGYRMDINLIEKVIAAKKSGDSMTVTVARNGLIMELETVLKPLNATRFQLRDLPSPSTQQQNVYHKWIGGK